MIHIPRRKLALAAFYLAATVHPARSFLTLRPTASSRGRMMISSASPIRMAAPGVEVASPQDIHNALQHPDVTVIDARSVGELEQHGYFNSALSSPHGPRRWIHAEATKEKAPLLQVAAETLLPDKEAPVVVYCGSGIRATTCKNVLEQQGYKTVLNAGGLADLNSVISMGGGTEYE